MKIKELNEHLKRLLSETYLEVCPYCHSENLEVYDETLEMMDGIQPLILQCNDCKKYSAGLYEVEYYNDTYRVTDEGEIIPLEDFDTDYYDLSVSN